MSFNTSDFTYNLLVNKYCRKMKKLLMLFALLLFVVETTSAAGKIDKFCSLGVRAGINLPTSGNIVFRPTFGGFCDLSCGDIISISIGLDYCRELDWHSSTFSSSDAQIGNLNIPIMLNFYVIEGLALKVGFQVDALIARKGDARRDSFYSALVMPLGISYDFDCGLIIEAKFNLDYLKNSAMQFSVGYRF